MLSDNNRQTLKDLAKASIEHRLKYDRPLQIDLATMADELTVQRSTFVTLEKKGKLRGCIGMLEACEPLADLSIHLSILSPSELIPCQSEAELIQQLRPDIDGLILDDGLHRTTFLPSVWESLPKPTDFIHHLKIKAGIAENYWSQELRVYRYTTESF